MAPEFFKKITGKFIKDVKDPIQRKILIDNAVGTYLKRLKSKPAGDESIYEPLEDLANKFEDNFITPVEIYFNAYEANPSEKRFLRIIVNDIIRRNDFCLANVAYLKAIAEVEENCFPYYEYILKCYINAQQQEEIVKTYEEIYKNIKKFKTKKENNEPIPPDLQWSKVDQLEHDSINYLSNAYVYASRIDDEAIEIYEIILKNDPENITMIKQLSKRYLNDKRRDIEAVGMYEICLAYDPNNYTLVKALCESYDHINQPQQKITLMESYLKENPDEESFLSELVHHYISNNKLNSETISLLKLYYKKHPTENNILFQIAEFYAGQHEITSEAVSIYEKVLALSNASLTIQFLLGRYYFDKKQWKDVIRLYEKIRETLKDSSEAIIPLAVAYAQYNRFDAEALKLYERALQQGTRNESVATILCREYFKKHRRDARTIKVFKDVMEIHPKNYFARLGMCDYYEHLGQYSTAIDESIVLIREKSDNDEALKILTRSIIAFDFPDEVEKLKVLPIKLQTKILEEVYQKRPKSKAVVLALADIFIQEDISSSVLDTTLTEELFKNALTFKNNHIPYLFFLSELNHKKGTRIHGINYDKQIYHLCNKEMNFHHKKKNYIYSEIFLKVLERLSNFYLEGGKTDSEAEEIFIACYSLGKRNSQLILTLAEIFMRKLSTSLLAMEVYELALKETSYNPMLEKLLLRAQIENKVYEPVLRYVQKELTKNHKAGDALAFAKELILKSNQVPDILLEALETTYKNSTNDVTLNSILSICYLKKKKFDKDSVIIFEKASANDPDNKELLSALAKCYEKTGDYSKTTNIYEKVLDGAEIDPNITLNLAKNYQKTNVKNKQALEIIKQAVNLDPYDTDLLLFLLDLYFEHGLKKEAIKTINQVVDNFPEIRSKIIEKLEKEKDLSTWDVELFLTLAFLYIEERRFDDALGELNKLFVNFKHHYGDLMDAYNKILTMDPYHVQARIERAILYKLVGDFTEAIYDLESLDDDVRLNPNVLFELAEIYSAYLNSLKELNPEYIYKLGIVYFQIADYDKSIEMFQKLLKNSNYIKDANYYLARAFHKKDAYEVALEYCKAMEKTDEIKKLMYDIGDKLYTSGDLRHALNAYQLIMTEDISFRDVSLKVQELRKEIQEQAVPERDKIFEELSQRAQQRFELIEKIGSGNMGIVYKAYDSELDEIVALKILPEQFSNDANAVNRFKQEAKAARKLSHVNIVRIHDIGEEQGRKYISMEYIDGGDLKIKLFKEKKLSLDQTIAISLQISEALSYAHRINIVHRDIKPANILMTLNGDAKLSDFGIAAILADAKPADTSGLIIGTPLYMSPEQTEGDPCTLASDIYSLGVVMYEMISGNPPFTVGNIAYHHIFSKPPALIDVNNSLAKIIYKCLEKKPEQRFSSAEEIVAELKKI